MDWVATHFIQFHPSHSACAPLVIGLRFYWQPSNTTSAMALKLRALDKIFATKPKLYRLVYMNNILIVTVVISLLELSGNIT